MRHVSEAVGRGGRLGAVASLSGSYEHDVRIPGVKGTGVTPEELIAGAWVACFGMTFIDRARIHDVEATDVEYRASVVLEASRGDYSITEAMLEVFAPEIDVALLEELIASTHASCPVSKLISGAGPAVSVIANLEPSPYGAAMAGRSNDGK